jgi:hypothetical protein
VSAFQKFEAQRKKRPEVRASAAAVEDMAFGHRGNHGSPEEYRYVRITGLYLSTS